MGYDDATPKAPEIPEDIRNQTRGNDGINLMKSLFYTFIFSLLISLTILSNLLALVTGRDLNYIPNYYKSLFGGAQTLTTPQTPIEKMKGEKNKIYALHEVRESLEWCPGEINLHYFEKDNTLSSVVVLIEDCFIEMSGNVQHTEVQIGLDYKSASRCLIINDRYFHHSTNLKKFAIINTPNQEDYDKWSAWLTKIKKQDNENKIKYAAKLERYAMEPRRVLPPN